MNAQLLEVLEREGVPGPHEVRDWVARLLVVPVADGPEDEVTALDRPRART